MTKEPQYGACIDTAREAGFARFGLMSNQVWRDDPKRLAFVLARYKFVSKMLEGQDQVLEVGCADGFGTRLVCQTVNRVTAVDFDPVFIEDAMQRNDPKWDVTYRVHDMLEQPVSGSFDAAYAIDVLEHIRPEDEGRFLNNLVASLKPHGVLIVGTPTVESQAYASVQSKAGHVNCKTGETMKETMSRYFHNVFIFSMNDEVIHTGFPRMAHYVFGVCAGKRS